MGRWRNDAGQAAGPEMMVLLVFALAAWGVLAWLGRLQSTSQDLVNTAQAAARAASFALDPAAARQAASTAVADSNLSSPCVARPRVAMSWAPGDTGEWMGGSVTITLSCTINNDEAFAGAGRTITASDTQVIDPYRS